MLFGTTAGILRNGTPRTWLRKVLMVFIRRVPSLLSPKLSIVLTIEFSFLVDKNSTDNIRGGTTRSSSMHSDMFIVFVRDLVLGGENITRGCTYQVSFPNQHMLSLRDLTKVW